MAFLAQQYLEQYQTGALYKKGMNKELDITVYKFHDFANQFDKICQKYPEEKQKLSLFLMIEYMLEHGML